MSRLDYFLGSPRRRIAYFRMEIVQNVTSYMFEVFHLRTIKLYTWCSDISSELLYPTLLLSRQTLLVGGVLNEGRDR